MDFKEYLQRNVVVLDGGTGTLLQEAGLPVGELPERWNITHAETVIDLHRQYFDAGSNVVCTNTFGANALKFTESELEEIVRSAVENARKAQTLSAGKGEKFVALDIGPLGKLLKPYGDLDFEDAVEIFAKTVRLGVKYGVDLVFIETMGDTYETKAVMLAVKENGDLPMLVSGAYGSDGKMLTGADPSAFVALVETLGGLGVGANCSLGAKQLSPIVDKLLARASVPVLVKPNAGLPKTDGTKTYYDVTAEEFALQTAEFIKKGARIVGGCCGTTPAYIRALKKAIENVPPVPLTRKNIPCVSSYTHAVDLSAPIVIGERINPTGKKLFKQALIDGNTDYALNEAVAQVEKGAHVLDVNVGLPVIDEISTLTTYVQNIQSVVNAPLQIDTANVDALESALRVYNGKPLINSVNGKKESMDAVFPLVKKYGGAVVALTLDERGIPDNVDGRVTIAKRIIAEAEKYGIEKKDILVDTLTMSVATDKNAPNVTLGALKEVKKLGVGTVLGVSNVSFGLPSRDTVNATFFALALQNGLIGAIANPNSVEMMKTYRAYRALTGADENCAEYMDFATNTLANIVTTTQTAQNANADVAQNRSALHTAIVKGIKSGAETACENLLQSKTPLQIIEEDIIPALDEIGKAYENKKAFLPNLLISADTAKVAFEILKTHMANSGEKQEKKCPFVIATVQGDIHDIGKNIVKTLLENYAFDVVDLGKDVPPEKVVESAIALKAPLVGLSALMTTTLPSMEKTVQLLKTQAPFCKIVVGGAVLNQDYADKIGADKYAKDGMETVRFAQDVFAELCKNT